MFAAFFLKSQIAASHQISGFSRGWKKIETRAAMWNLGNAWFSMVPNGVRQIKKRNPTAGFALSHPGSHPLAGRARMQDPGSVFRP